MAHTALRSTVFLYHDHHYYSDFNFFFPPSHPARPPPWHYSLMMSKRRTAKFVTCSKKLTRFTARGTHARVNYAIWLRRDIGDELFGNYAVWRWTFYLFALSSCSHVVETVFPRQLTQISVNVDDNNNIIETTTTTVARRAVSQDR